MQYFVVAYGALYMFTMNLYSMKVVPNLCEGRNHTFVCACHTYSFKVCITCNLQNLLKVTHLGHKIFGIS